MLTVFLLHLFPRTLPTSSISWFHHFPPVFFCQSRCSRFKIGYYLIQQSTRVTQPRVAVGGTDPRAHHASLSTLGDSPPSLSVDWLPPGHQALGFYRWTFTDRHGLGHQALTDRHGLGHQALNDQHGLEHQALTDRHRLGHQAFGAGRRTLCFNHCKGTVIIRQGPQTQPLKRKESRSGIEPSFVCLPA